MMENPYESPNEPELGFGRAFHVAAARIQQQKWRLVGACAMVAVVHAFMVGLEIPRAQAWYLGAMIYAGLVAVLFSRRSLFDKLGTYFMFAVVTLVGAITVCPCTSAHFIFAPLAGLLSIALVHRTKRVLPRQWVSTPPPAARGSGQEITESDIIKDDG